MPGQVQPGKLRRELGVDPPFPELLRLLRDVHRRQALARIVGEILLELIVHLLRIDVAHDDEEQVIRDVPELVILHHVVALELVVRRPGGR